MLPAAAWDEETREGEMGLDLLLGLGLLAPPTMAASSSGGDHGGGSAAQQQRRHRPYGKKAGFHEEPFSFAAATETAAASAKRRRLTVDVDDGGDGVPASMLKAASSTARWPAHATSSPKGRAHAVSTPTRGSPRMQRAPCCPAAAGGLFVGSSRPPVAAAARSSHGDSTAPMTMIYAGSVREYAGVTMEHAEKILAMVAKEAHAAGIGIGILPVQQLAEPPQMLQLVAAPTGGGAAQRQMTMHWGLAHHVSDSLKRAASLARFLDKRKQRAETSAATILHHPPRREEWFPAQIMDDDDAPAATVSATARTSVSLGGMDRRPQGSQDHPKRMKANHAEEADGVSTELKI